MRLTDDHTLYVPHGEVRTPVWLLLPLRLYSGLFFIVSALHKVEGRLLTQPEKYSAYIRHVQDSGSGGISFYDRFVDAVIIPNIGAVTMVLVLMQLVIGLGLFTGSFTRLFGFLGMFFMLNVFLLHDVSIFGAHYSVVMFLVLGVLVVTGAGRAYGMDHRLVKRFPRWLV
jgi:uncharacterized membrane protein YphA (DoxX/SURF4 family)